MTTRKLRDCRGFVDTINELCCCGGSDRENGCDACKIYHAIGDWLTVEAPAITVIASDTMKPGTAMLTDGKTAVKVTGIGEPVEKRCGTCAHWDKRVGSIHDLSERGECQAPRPDSCASFRSNTMYSEFGDKCPCWKAKP